jgi:dihydroxyacid dehydratase/phosphogluconate dehydratase
LSYRHRKDPGGEHIGGRHPGRRIHPPAETAYSDECGLAILYGNLAPEGAVVKSAGVDPWMLRFEGPAVIFESQEEACEGS